MKRTTDPPVDSSKVLQQQPTPSRHQLTQPLVDNQFLCHLFLLHTPIRLFLDKVLSSVNTLTPLAPDAHLDDLNRRLIHLSNVVLSHCRIEDRTIFPILSKAIVRPVSNASPHRTAKRPRLAASPVSVDAQPIHDDHQHLGLAFEALRNALGQLRAAPMLKPQSLPMQSQRVNSIANASPSPNNSTASPLNSPYQTTYDPRAMNRQEGVIYVKRMAKQLADRISEHLRNEESYALPIAASYLSHAEQKQLVLRVTNDTVSVQHLPDAFRLVPHGNLVGLLRFVAQHASDRDNKRIALTLAKVLSVSQWRAICADVPTLANMQLPKHNSLIEISHMHKAITKELCDIVAYCESIDTSNPRQMQSLSFRVNFLRRVHSYHAEGEESVLLRELHARLSSSPDSTATNAFHDDHDDESSMFNDFSSKLKSLQTQSARQSRERCDSETAKQNLLESVRNLASHLKHHMEEEETKLLPLLRKYFSLEDQDRMMRLVMAKVPPTFLRELIPWMFNLLDVDDQECMLRNLMRTAPSNEICKVISSIAQSVQKGMTDRMKWNEICLRVPEVELDYKSIVEKCEMDNDGPISEILRVHKAFRIELNTILRRTKEIRADGSAPNPLSLNSIMESVTFLGRMVADHSKAEDDILLPRLEAKSPGISDQYKEDHCDEAQLFQDFGDFLTQLRCVTDESECTQLVQKLHLHARVLRDEMVKHLDLEEKQLWPICQKQFDEKEQSEIVALIFGQIPSIRLREMLPWMIRLLSVSERNTMMNHILMVTKSTMFEKWLNTWLPLDNDSAVQSGSSSTERVLSNQSPSVTDTGLSVAKAARLMLQGRENLEHTMRSIARDSSLTVQERTRMMQRIMLAPYQQRSIDRANTSEKHEEDDLRKTYVEDENGVKHLGCKHYRRRCKLRAACCQKLYTCRLCHDAEQTHVMDRSATKEILCMECATLQPVAASCVNEICRISFARYFCGICVFYDNRENAKVYHCHSCNVCRVGQGLGIDYFHCMKCNQCMHVKYRKRGHKCIQKAMESDCPVCFQYLFTSTSPVKYLQCGHLMHTTCYDRYRKNSIRCPICSRSLEEMTPLYQLLDQQLAATGANMMPAHYRSAQCDLYCKDCFTKSNTPYHFLYNKCPVCQSYNTRVEHIYPNGEGSSNR